MGRFATKRETGELYETFIALSCPATAANSLRDAYGLWSLVAIISGTVHDFYSTANNIGAQQYRAVVFMTLNACHSATVVRDWHTRDVRFSGRSRRLPRPPAPLPLPPSHQISSPNTRPSSYGPLPHSESSINHRCISSRQVSEWRL